MINWAMSWDYGTVNSFFKRAWAAIQWAKSLLFGRTLRLLPYFMCPNWEGSGETARMHRLAWAIAGRICDKTPKNICVFQVSRPYLGFCHDPKHFIVNSELNVVKFAGKWGKMYWKMQFLYKIFGQNEMLCRLTIPSFFRAETWNTHFFFFFFFFFFA